MDYIYRRNPYDYYFGMFPQRQLECTTSRLR